MDDKEQIRAMYRKYWQCMMAKDAKGLRDLMMEDYVLEHITGVIQPCEAFLRGLLDGTFNYYAADHDSIEVEIQGEHARMTGCSRVLAAVYRRKKNSWRLRGDFTLRRENGTWKFTRSKASTY